MSRAYMLAHAPFFQDAPLVDIELDDKPLAAESPPQRLVLTPRRSERLTRRHLVALAQVVAALLRPWLQLVVLFLAQPRHDLENQKKHLSTCDVLDLADVEDPEPAYRVERLAADDDDDELLLREVAREFAAASKIQTAWRSSPTKRSSSCDDIALYRKFTNNLLVADGGESKPIAVPDEELVFFADEELLREVAGECSAAEKIQKAWRHRRPKTKKKTQKKKVEMTDFHATALRGIARAALLTAHLRHCLDHSPSPYLDEPTQRRRRVVL